MPYFIISYHRLIHLLNSLLVNGKMLFFVNHTIDIRLDLLPASYGPIEIGIITATCLLTWATDLGHPD